MHPSVYIADPDAKPRRATSKRDRRASCSAAIPSLTYQIPSLRKIERSHSASQGSTQSRMRKIERSHSASQGSPHSRMRKIERTHSSQGSMRSRLRKIERTHSSSQGSTHSRHERRGSCSSIASLSDSYSTQFSLSDSYSTVSSTSSVKSCTFVENPEVIHVPAATSLAGESLWYQKEDFDNFRKKTQRIINSVDKNGRGKNGKKYCTRGLEKYIVRAHESRERKSLLAALDEDESSSFTSTKSEKVEESKPGEKKSGSFHKRMMRGWRRKSNE